MQVSRTYILSLLMLAVLVLQGCVAQRTELGILQATPQPIGNTERIFVATVRAPSEDKNILFSGERSDKLRFADITVSIPKVRVAGAIKYPGKTTDRSKEFAATSVSVTEDEASFAGQIKSTLADLPASDRNIVVFVHGYNVSFAAGVFNHAQLKKDYGFRGLALHYSWPSAAETALYLYDRESAEFAREGLARTLKIAQAANPNSITLVAHSMGTYLTMETLRSLSLQGETELIEKIEPLILAAPDIDVDVFRAQLAEMTVRPKTIVVLVSNEDRALKASSRLRGGRARVGLGANKDELLAEGIIVLDLASIRKKGDKLSHSTFANSPQLIELVRSGALNFEGHAANSAIDGTNLIGETLGTAGDLISSIVYLPAKLVGAR